MRCEICGVPIDDGETRCSRCSSRRFSSSPPESTASPEKTPSDKDTIDSWEKISLYKQRGPAEPESRAAAVSIPPEATRVVLEGKYQLLDEIGRGAMGTVFRAEDFKLKRSVAVKFLLPDLASSADCASRFRSEAVGMASIRDNNVAQIYAYGEYGNTPYFVMEFLDGETVESIIDAHNRRGFFIRLSEAIDIMVQMASGLAAIHKAGVVHRDIKPGNVMVEDESTRAVIMDFGLVRNVQVEDETRALAGTPAYMAPELAEGGPGSDRSPLTDIYSLGASAYEILTGSLPFTGDTWIDILRKHITEVPSVPSTKRPGMPEELDEIVFRMLSKDPRERYQSCEEILGDLLAVEQMALPEEDHLSYDPDSRPTSQRRSSRKFGSSRPPGAVRSTPTYGRGRLLVVDPDSSFRSFVHGVAKSAVPGCRVHSATDGAMALHLFDEFKPHAVLLDLSLPEINGLEVAATLRGDPANAETAIIVVADRGGRPEARILNRLGVNHFLTKPIDREDLADLLRPILERPGYTRSSTPRPVV